MTANKKEKVRLRELAKQQLEMAHSQIMDVVYKRQWNLNNATGGTDPVVRIETENFVHELVPDKTIQCETPLARTIERRLLFLMNHHHLTGDDRLIPKTYSLEWIVNVDPYGFPIEKDIGQLGNKHTNSFSIRHAIDSIEDDFHKLKPLAVSVDRPGTESLRAQIEDLIGDILPVEMVGWPKGVTFLTRCLLDLISMEGLYHALYDEPDGVHRIMEYVLNNAFALMDFFEKERIMYINNDTTDMGNSTYPMTDALPAPGYTGVPRLVDMYLRTDSQETVGVSPAMFNEFFLPYYVRLCQRGGLWYYGCCEPVHDIWESSLSKIANIRKISISKWCDEEIMGSLLANKPMVYSRKLDALFLGGGFELDAKGLKKYIEATMRYAKECQVEFLAREIPSIYGNTAKLRDAVDIIRGVAYSS